MVVQQDVSVRVGLTETVFPPRFTNLLRDAELSRTRTPGVCFHCIAGLMIAIELYITANFVIY